MLFSTTNRTDLGPKTNTESRYQFLNRSARPENGRIRDLLESWAEQIPPTEQAKFIREFSSGDDIQFHASLFELYVHELLLQSGHKIEIHPKLSGTNKRPDFRGQCPGDGIVYVECTVATEESVQDRHGNKLLDEAFDALDQIRSPNVFLGLDVTGAPASSIPIRKWRHQVQTWVDSLDCKALERMGPDPDLDELPELELLHDGLLIVVRPILKKPSARGTAGRAIGAQGFEGVFVTSRLEIRKAVRDKAGRYGTLDAPYVIAVNCLGCHADEEEITGAFFGIDGLWGKPAHPKHTRVSAVLAVQELLPATLGSAPTTLFINPHAAHPYHGPLTKLRQYGQFGEIPGLATGTILGIPPGWPREQEVDTEHR
jgi:hypothetical protein